MKAPQHDRADELENERELTGDVASAVRDFASEEQGYHKIHFSAGGCLELDNPCH